MSSTSRVAPNRTARSQMPCNSPGRAYRYDAPTAAVVLICSALSVTSMASSRLYPTLTRLSTIRSNLGSESSLC